MKNLILLVIAFTFNFLTTSNVQALEKGVATVEKVFGSVRVKKLISGTVSTLGEKNLIDEGDFIQTSDKSFVKLQFHDETQILISPNSKFLIRAYPKNDSGILVILKGEVRSLVSKKYPDNVDQSKSKLYLKTRTAVFGIRGTDFQIDYNPDTQNTSLVTFEGKVAMTAIEEDNLKLDRNKLEELLNRREAVLVEGGHASVVDRSFSRKTMKPVRINENQFKILKEKNSHLIDYGKAKHEQEKKAPPAEAQNEDELAAKARGFNDKATGDYKAPDGSLIDLDRSTIVPLPKEAEFDRQSRTFKLPEQLGTLNRESGRFEIKKEHERILREKFKAKEERPPIREKDEKRQRPRMEKPMERREGSREGTREPLPAPLPTIKR